MANWYSQVNSDENSDYLNTIKNFEVSKVTYSDLKEGKPIGVVTIFYKNEKGEIFGFATFGHSGYAEIGKDIVCAGVSTLVLATGKSIEKFTKDKTIFDFNKEGYVKFFLPNLKQGQGSGEAIVLLKELYLGMTEIMKNYGEKYLKVFEIIEK